MSLAESWNHPEPKEIAGGNSVHGTPHMLRFLGVAAVRSALALRSNWGWRFATGNHAAQESLPEWVTKLAIPVVVIQAQGTPQKANGFDRMKLYMIHVYLFIYLLILFILFGYTHKY